jgi:molybdopterin-guanine dinucleotide biosynthesis protein A
MTTKTHNKHGKTTKAHFGHFGRQEIAIMGAPCNEIKKLAGQLIDRLKDFRIAYIDADHKTGIEEVPSHLQAGASAVYNDKIKFHRIDFAEEFDQYRRNMLFNEYDLVLVNGNHFQASAQIVIIDERKPLEKKLGKITKPLAILRQNQNERLPDFIEKHLGKELEIQPMYSLDQVDKLANLIRNSILLSVPPLLGLVLAGGKSSRMGQDKGLLEYHGLPQRTYLYELLEGLTEATYLSCRPDQSARLSREFKLIADSIEGLGPFGAIISAFREFPNHAWLVVACDLPMIDKQSVLSLIHGRNPSKIATAFYNEATGFPDPLFTIWEPKAYLQLMHFLALGYSCPRKVLINSNTEVLEPADDSWLLNANDAAAYHQAIDTLKSRKMDGQ